MLDRNNTADAVDNYNGNVWNQMVTSINHNLQPCHRRNVNQSTIFRGISRYDGCFEAFLWDKDPTAQRGKSVYIGSFKQEEAAAKAYDLATLKWFGTSPSLNFPLVNYMKDLEEMKHMTKKEYLLKIRRSSHGFSKGVSTYRGVTRKSSKTNATYKKWQARLGKGGDSKGSRIKSFYLGTYETEEQAARAYDVASIRLRGFGAITNFDIQEYNVEKILESPMLPTGKGASKLIQKHFLDEIIMIRKGSQNSNTRNVIASTSQMQTDQESNDIASSSSSTKVLLENPILEGDLVDDEFQEMIQEMGCEGFQSLLGFINQESLPNQEKCRGTNMEDSSNKEDNDEFAFALDEPPCANGSLEPTTQNGGFVKDFWEEEAEFEFVLDDPYIN